MPVSATSLPFSEQIEFFRRKLNIPTEGWTDIYGAEHDWAFMVAGANRNALVEDFRQAVEKAIAGGGTLEQFRRDFDRIVATHGWSYNGGRNWRSRVIYETNLRSSYMAGRHQQLLELRTRRPYWVYEHDDAVEHPRPLHESWDGLVLRWDDPWWQTHFPINAWGCQCSVRALSEADLKRMGKDGPDQAPAINWVTHTIGQRSPNGPREVVVPDGIDPGFEHVPGQSRLISRIPPEAPGTPSGSSGVPGVPNRPAPDPLPPPRALPADMLLPRGLSDEDYAAAFLAPFGATLDTPVLYTDVMGEVLAIGKELFTTRRTGQIKANKHDRGRTMVILAEALQRPDEIWVRIEYHHGKQVAVVRRRYIAEFEIPGENVPALAVFELGADGWSGITVFNPQDYEINDLRFGVRIYRRE